MKILYAVLLLMLMPFTVNAKNTVCTGELVPGVTKDGYAKIIIVCPQPVQINKDEPQVLYVNKEKFVFKVTKVSRDVKPVAPVAPKVPVAKVSVPPKPVIIPEYKVAEYNAPVVIRPGKQKIMK